jgi:hypothetical protein
LKKFITSFGKDCIAGLLADREFVGEDWFGWLLDEIKLIQAKQTTMRIIMQQKRTIQILADTQKLPSTSDFSQIEEKRELSEPDITRIKKSIQKIIDESNQHRICNEVIYAV